MRPVAIAACVLGLVAAAPASAALPRIRAVLVSASTGARIAETTGAAPRPLAGAIGDGRGGFFASGAHGVVRLRADGTRDPRFTDADVASGPLALAGGVLVSVGATGLRFLDPRSGAAVHPPLPLAGPGTRVLAPAIAASGSRVFVVGSTVRGEAGSAQLAFGADARTGTRTAWHPVIRRGIATAVAAAGAVVYLGGRFARVGGAPRCGLAAVSAASGAVRGWTSRTCPAQSPTAMLATAHALYVGRLGGFLAVRADTGAKLSWSTRTSQALARAGVASLALAGRTLYVGTVADAAPVRLGGTLRAGYLALDTANGHVRAWRITVAPHQNGRALAVSGTRVLAYGSFS